MQRLIIFESIEKIIQRISEHLNIKAPTKHDSADDTYGKGTAANYGHVKLSDAINESTAANSGGTAATPKAVNDAFTASKSYADKLVAAIDAAAMKGTVGEGGDIQTMPTSGYKSGWMYRVVAPGIYAGHDCEAGDIIIAVRDYESGSASDSDWTALQVNISGAVVGPDSAVRGNIPIFNNETGKVIGDSGVPISSNRSGGIAIGEEANFGIHNPGNGGVAIGSGAQSGSGGAAVGANTSVGWGGAVGCDAYANGGGAVGTHAKAEEGGAVGSGAKAGLGGAVGAGTWAGDGFSGGLSARVKNNGTSDAPNYIDAIQLGRGTNENPFTLQTYDYQVTDTTKTSSTDDGGETWLKDVGRLRELDTDDKTSIVAAMNELKTLLLNARYQSFVRRPIFTTSPPEGNKYVELAEFSGDPSIDFPYGAMPITFTLVPYEFHSGGGTPRKSAEPVYVSIIPRYWNGSGQFPLTITYWGNSDYEIYLDATGSTTDYEMPFRLVLPATNDNNNIRWSVYDCVNPYEHIDISFIDAKTEFAGSTKATVNEFFKNSVSIVLDPSRFTRVALE